MSKFVVIHITPNRPVKLIYHVRDEARSRLTFRCFLTLFSSTAPPPLKIENEIPTDTVVIWLENQ